MALARRSGKRFEANIWPGFVDAMTSLLLVLMFVLTIFMIVQFMLRETISGQEHELDELTGQIASLADALGLERSRAAGLEGDVGRLTASLATAQSEGEAQAALIARLTADLNAGAAARTALEGRVADFEAQVAALLAERDTARGERDTALSERDTARDAAAALGEERTALEAALAASRSETDRAAEEARLAAARREAVEALVADLRREASEREAALAEAETAREAAAEALSEEEKARLAEAEAARMLRERLAGAETEITAMTLALEEQRRRAEETLTLLAAARASEAEMQARIDAGAAALTEAERNAALRAAAEARLAEEAATSAEAQRRVTLLNEQVAALRTQLGQLQGMLDAAAEKDRLADVQIESLGSQLNVALAQVADEQRRRAEMEEAERRRLEEEAAGLRQTAEDLERYRSEFFGRLRDILAGREGVRIVGDRFVFSSEVLFQTGSADLAPEGRAQIASVAALLLDVARDIPPGIDWILRVDGHTDRVPISGGGRFADNWELSQARALSVVRYMTDALGFPAERLAATGFGEFQPVATGDSPEALAQNRRIELKLTER